LVDEEAPHELMRDGGEPPIHGGLIPNHRGEIHATLNLTEKEKVGKKGVEERGGDMREGSQKGDRKNSGTKYRVNDSREGE
jgi:hypothetical protein